MNEKDLGKRVQQIREKSGLTQEEVELRLGLPQKAITRIETGQRRISTLELSKLAELFHKPIADFLIDKEIAEEDVLITLYRIAPGLEKNPKIQEQVAHCVQICREGMYLERLLNISSKQRFLSYPFENPTSVSEAIKQGEQAAKEERRRIGLGSLPIYDIVETLSSQGLWCSNTDLPSEISGLFLQNPSIGRVILINSNHMFSRQRFSYAHEYAHALLDSEHNILISTIENSTEFKEKRANAFAAAFLIPEDGLSEMIQSLNKGFSSRSNFAVFDVATEGVFNAEQRQFANKLKITPQDVALIAHHFGVSYQATIYRLYSLQYISQKEREKLLEEESLGRNYLKMLNLLNDLEQKTTSFQRELRVYISRLVIESYRQKKISRGRLFELSKLLSLSGQKLLEQVNIEN